MSCLFRFWNVVLLEVKFKCLLLKNCFSSSEQCFSSAERRLSGLINADGKVRRILMTPVLLTWDWEFLNMPMFNLILMLPNLAKLLLVCFFLSATFHWNFLPFLSFLGHGYIRYIIHSWSLSKQHSMTSEVCWKPVPRQVYFTINHAHWRLWLYFWYVSGSCFSCSQTIFIYILFNYYSCLNIVRAFPWKAEEEGSWSLFIFLPELGLGSVSPPLEVCM